MNEQEETHHTISHTDPKTPTIINEHVFTTEIGQNTRSIKNQYRSIKGKQRNQFNLAKIHIKPTSNLSYKMIGVYLWGFSQKIHRENGGIGFMGLCHVTCWKSPQVAGNHPLQTQLAHRRRPPKIAPPFRRKSALPRRPSSPTGSRVPGRRKSRPPATHGGPASPGSLFSCSVWVHHDRPSLSLSIVFSLSLSLALLISLDLPVLSSLPLSLTLSLSAL
jgi:hypothetical protein